MRSEIKPIAQTGHGIPGDDRPTSIAYAASWCAFDQTLAELRGGFVDLPAEALTSLIDEAIAANPVENV